LVTSVAFGLVHAQYGWFLLGTIALGLALGWARSRSGGLLAPIVVHAVFNAYASSSLVL